LIVKGANSGSLMRAALVDSTGCAMTMSDADPLPPEFVVVPTW